ncbi:hypothetical protein EJ02DRAFT_459663 [Clathrospora elynae]|uniref:Uncharacterized protein n=1 Tax=Clathrospora elynae TaxID=706981 RepID=A0A6A5S9Q7_9PLEO|nr:hypothetical protein EJ02DRAFT_459663 [Clathrospora elynae]
MERLTLTDSSLFALPWKAPLLALPRESSLLALPRELRDLIIDQALLEGFSAPQRTLGVQNHVRERNTADDPVEILVVPPIPQLSIPPLLFVNTQLSAETKQRIPKLNMPLTLEVLVAGNATMQCIWVNVPWKGSRGKIRMQINVRVQAVNLEKIRVLERLDTAVALDWRITDSLVASRVTRQVSSVVKSAVSGVLGVPTTDSDLESVISYISSHRRRQALEAQRPCNTIAHLQINVDTAAHFSLTPVLDYAGKKCCRSEQDLGHLAEALRDAIDKQFFENGKGFSRAYRSREPALQDMRVLLSRVGHMEMRAAGRRLRVWPLEELLGWMWSAPDIGLATEKERKEHWG